VVFYNYLYDGGLLVQSDALWTDVAGISALHDMCSPCNCCRGSVCSCLVPASWGTIVNALLLRQVEQVCWMVMCLLPDRISSVHRCTKCSRKKSLKNVVKIFLNVLKRWIKTLVIICLTFCLMPNAVGAV